MTITAPLDDLADILAARAVRSVYQPIVDLDSGRVVGVEALARGPEGSALERPDLLFAAARRHGLLAELDLACRAAAIRGALDAGLPRSIPLFVNIEPEVAHAPIDDELRRLVTRASDRLHVVVEVTERSLVHSPAELLAVLAAVRELGWGIALDDVGAEVESLALMPFVRPDVIKLDLRLVQEQADADIAAIVAAVTAEAERTGARVLAEGIETTGHRDAALSLGATLGQGWLFARPGPVPASLDGPATFVPVAAPASPQTSIVDAAAAGRPLRRSTKRLLLEMSWHLEREALNHGAATVVLSTFQTAERFTPATQRRYADLASRTAFVGALGTGIGRQPAPGVRGGSIAVDDPLVDEWVIAVVAPHFSAVLAARDLHDDGPDDERRFDAVLTYDRDRVLSAASSLMARITRRS
ncbi:sensor domain-containing phosphodiesterase [Actinomarinicola tropica]|uniref:EAL domain-containing protein n=1 Tax=Actinomarinicola tropica TaxID=2789776 RepID=A0A5Q2RFZ1_9ACTN|nr:EAL domain-containing protein [Actinomarinicola tropica]QGG94564.1 EAL domain-containing protein [Actinomarinicola tropica]